MITIYCIRNMVDGRVYVGQTGSKLAQRMTRHYSDAKSNKPGRLFDAIRLHGRDAFQVEPLEENVPLAEGNASEERWVKQLDARNPDKGYNILPGGKRAPKENGIKVEFNMTDATYAQLEVLVNEKKNFPTVSHAIRAGIEMLLARANPPTK